MSEKLTFNNWSLKKLLSTISDSFEQAKVKILYTFLIFSILKLVIIIPIIYHNGQVLHLRRAFIMLVIYLILTKFLLINKKFTNAIAHLMIWMGLVLVLSILFNFAKNLNLLSLQFIFMIILSSFYLINRNFGIMYSILAIIPAIIYLLGGESIRLTGIVPNALGSPAYEITVVLNFVTIVIAHYLFHQALSNSVTEKELLNEQFKIAVDEANRAAQSKSDFLSTMSHELRTPLNSVIGMAELLKEEFQSPEQKENLNILNFSAVSLHTLINDILDFNKLGSEKLQLEKVSVNLYHLLNDICSGLRIQAREKGLDLNLNIDPEIKNTPVLTDPTRISQIIYNLAGNAVKFTAEGNITVELKVNSEDDKNLSIGFSVSDTGIGISKEKQALIFEPFIQASTSTTRNYGGTGLGLAIVRRLLNLFNSVIQVESSESEGSKFWFEITFEKDLKPVIVIDEQNETGYDLGNLKVLIVEDNPINSLLLKKIFEKWHNVPDFAKDGYEALAKVAVHSYDLALMDIHMPLLDGYETARQI
ncbi:MAG: ATP-binding protein, partial [Pedobacter sp.]